MNNWGPGFLPAEFQGTPFSATNPVRHLVPPKGVSTKADLAARDLLRSSTKTICKPTRATASWPPAQASYELAARMQLSVPEISDLSTEPAHSF